jgi:hypothetical protein
VFKPENVAEKTESPPVAGIRADDAYVTIAGSH